MAALEFNVPIGVVGTGITTGTALKTLAQITAPTNQAVIVKGFTLGFKGTSGTDAPVEVYVVRQTGAGTSSAVTPTKADSARGEAIQTACLATFTVEPTYGDILGAVTIHPQGSLVGSYFFPHRVICPGGGRVGLVVKSSVSNTVLGSFFCEE